MLPEYDERAEICTALTKETIVATIKGHPEARAVVVTRPTYYGYCCDIEGVAEFVITSYSIHYTKLYEMIFCYIIYIHPSERGRGVCGKGEM